MEWNFIFSFQIVWLSKLFKLTRISNEKYDISFQFNLVRVYRSYVLSIKIPFLYAYI